MVKKRPKVQVNYRSGISVVVECDSFTVRRSLANAIQTVEWKNAVPNPLHLGVDDIESVWQLS